MRRPAVLFDARKGAFRCPCCGEIIELPSSDDTDGWTAAKPEAFRTETRRNHKCTNCGELLWAAVNPSVPAPWVKIPEYGWVHRKLAAHAMQKTKNPAALDALLSLHENPDGYFPTRGACRRYPLSSYIKKRYRGRLDGLIVDELHEYNNDSGQGDAMAELFGTAKKVIGMTATLINGYSSGIFHLLYRTSAQLMLADGKPHEKPALFNTEYGVVETTYTEADERYAAKRRSQKSGVPDASASGRFAAGVFPFSAGKDGVFVTVRHGQGAPPAMKKFPLPAVWMRPCNRNTNALRMRLYGYCGRTAAQHRRSFPRI